MFRFLILNINQNYQYNICAYNIFHVQYIIHYKNNIKIMMDVKEPPRNCPDPWLRAVTDHADISGASSLILKIH